MNSADPANSEILLKRAAGGDDHAVRELFELYRGRLKRMISLRLSNQLRGRMDDSDVLQDAMLEVARKLPDYLREPALPFYLWLRQIVNRKLIDAHRRHLGAEQRDARRELKLPLQTRLPAELDSLALQLSGKFTSPSVFAMREETRARVHEALSLMEPLDREVLALRHFEQLTNGEVAIILEIEAPAASKRYTRALTRLKKILAERP